ncbi:ABC transporter substrate-binding protein [Caldibacillus thermoamylovorans]|uniref:ABC transporter substrate-binding protein n=1 Tax=Caldibacillus thermoamylovorans TaxID=35841 RepID=UPI00203BFA7F|nr:extracellular solute-binding protein [Caldibacillus thermoamylovorans]MCM3478559.1 extracellular solute-binding protein [Caldibacillus thermoamylovorans]
MNKKVKRLSLGIIAGIFSLGIVACSNDQGKGTDNSNSKDSSDGLSGEVVMWTASLSGEPFDSYFEKLEAEFEKMHPNVDVIIQDIPQNEIEQKVLTSLTGGDAPDVVNLAPRYMVNIAKQGGLLELDDLVSDEVKDSYLEGPFNSGYFEDGLYALPWYLTTTVSWYNSDYFEQAGITKTPSNTQEIYETAKAITEATGKPSFYQIINEGDTVMEKMITLANGEPIVEKGKSVLQDNEKILEFFTLSQKMYQEGIMPQENVEGSFSTAQELFMAGNLALTESGVTFLGPIESGAPDVYKVAKAGQPLNDIDAPMNVAVMNFSIPSTTDNPDAAVALAEFVTNAKNQLEFAKVAGTVLPSTTESLEDEYFQNPGDSPKALGMLEASKSLNRSKVLIPILENTSELYEAVKMAYVKNILGDITPKEAVQEIADKWDESFSKNDIDITF